MQLNCYVVVDKISNTLSRIAFGATDGAFCRDNVNIDVRSKENPRGLPFDDVEYRCVGTLDTVTFELAPCEPRVVDILNSYKFNVETKATREEITPERL